jgi:hypothetical protein
VALNEFLVLPTLRSRTAKGILRPQAACCTPRCGALGLLRGSTIRHSFHFVGVPVALYRHCGGCVGDLAKLGRRKFHARCS